MARRTERWCASQRGAGEDPIAAVEIARPSPGQSLIIDADAKAFLAPFSKIPPGEYAVQAILDVNHNYAYAGLSAGDIKSTPIKVRLPGGVPKLILTDVQPSPLVGSASQQKQNGAEASSFESHLADVDFISPTLSAFWGRPMHIRAWVLTPPGYETANCVTRRSIAPKVLADRTPLAVTKRASTGALWPPPARRP